MIDLSEPVVSMIGGALLGALFSAVPKVLDVAKYTYRYFFVKGHLEGIWYTYHWTYIDHVPQLVTSEINIKKGIFNRYVIALVQNETTLSYNGTANIEDDHVVVTIGGKDHSEKTICRFHNTLPSSKKICGIWLSFDHDKKVASGGILFSKEKLENNIAISTLKSGIKNEKDASLMHVQSNPTRAKR